MEGGRGEWGRQGEEGNGRTDGGCRPFTLSLIRLLGPSLLTTRGQEVTDKKGKFQGHPGCALWSYDASSMILNSVLPPLKKEGSDGC